MGYSAKDIIPRFEKFAGQPDGYEPGKGSRPVQRFFNGSGSSLYYRTDAKGRVVGIMSYGSHFPLAHLLLTPGGKRKMWLLNGDRYQGASGFGRSNEHNDMMREAAQKGRTPTFVVPFSAVREAGIDMRTIVPVDVSRERFTWEDHSARKLSEVSEWYRKHDVFYDDAGQRVRAPRASDGSEAQPDTDGGGWHTWNRTALEGSVKVPVDGPQYEGRLTRVSEEVTRDEHGLYHWSEQRHWLAESVFRATVSTWDREGRRDVRHVRYFLAAFDEQEPRPLFFLAELPAKARPRTIAEAREALKPAGVVTAEQAGLEVLRQGDVFAIATAAATRDLPGPSERGAVLGVNHTASEVRMLGSDTYARGVLLHRPGWPRRPEHRKLVLGNRKGWYLLVKNTVPMVHGQSRAWSMGGRVD